MKQGKRIFQIVNEIFSLLVSLILIGIGGYLASGNWALPFMEALGSQIVGWVIAVVGGLSLFGSIVNMFFVTKKK